MVTTAVWLAVLIAFATWATPIVAGQRRDRGMNQPGAAGNRGGVGYRHQPARCGGQYAARGGGRDARRLWRLCRQVQAVGDPGLNQPGAAGNVGVDPGLNQPGAAGNRR